MKQITKIIAATDFSDNAKDALENAALIASKTEAELFIFHAYHPKYPGTDTPAELYEEIIKSEELRLKEKLHTLCEKVSKDFDISCQAQFVTGFAVDELLILIDEINADLLVMGTQGASGIKKVLFGSITAEIVRRSKAPVLAIPFDKEPILPAAKHFVFATTLSQEDIPYILEFNEFCKLMEASLTILHINKSTHEKIAEKVREFEKNLNSHQVTDYTFRYIHEEEILEGLDRFLSDHNAGMLAMVPGHKNFFERLLGQSISMEMMFQAKVPVMAMRHTK